MKYLAAFFSLVTVLVLFSALPTNSALNTNTEKQFSVPNKINPIVDKHELKVEKDWLAYLNEAEQPKVVTPKIEPTPPLFPALTIGDKNYQLLGIFKQHQQPFILVKGVGTDLVKLQEGDEFSKGIILQKITPSAIIILQGDKTINFKLFERSDNG